MCIKLSPKELEENCYCYVMDLVESTCSCGNWQHIVILAIFVCHSVDYIKSRDMGRQVESKQI